MLVANNYNYATKPYQIQSQANRNVSGTADFPAMWKEA